MSSRKTILAEGEIYHICNKTGFDLPLFKSKREYKVFLEAIRFYLQKDPSARFSIYRKSKASYPVDLSRQLVTIFCFCLMPTHFHFLLRQEEKEGTRKFVQRLCNSYSHYFNIRYKTGGSLFRGSFRAIRVENNEQLLHLSRYIHLNPVSNFLVETPKEWPFSSYSDYLGEKRFDFLDPSLILNQFQNPGEYKKFVLERKTYQRELEKIKHLILDS